MSKRKAGEIVSTTFSLGCLGGLIQAVANPSGWLWTGARALAFAIFVIALVLWLIAMRRDRRIGRIP